MHGTGAIYAAFLLSAALATAAEDNSLDLPRAVQMAYERNRELARLGRKVEQAALDIDSARADFAVRLQPATRFGRTQDGNSWAVGAGAVKKMPAGTELEASSQVETVYNGRESDPRPSVEVSLSQPLFRRFGALVQQEPVRLAESAQAASRRRFEDLKMGLVVQLVELFEDIRLLEDQIAADEHLRDRADQLYRLTQARERTGRVTRVDTLRAEGLRGEADARLASNRELVAARQRELADLLGAPMEKRWTLAPPPRVDVKDLAPDVAVGAALSNRLDLAQAVADTADRARGVDIARRQRFPDVSLLARYRQFTDDSHFPESQGWDNQDWFVGVGTVSELNFRKDRLVVDRAVSSKAESEQTVEIVAWTIAREVLQRVADYRRARTELAISERNATVAGGRARLARRLFDAGRGDPFSVSDAEESQSTADIHLRNVRADVSLTGYRLLRSLGTLTDVPAELKPAWPASGLDAVPPGLKSNESGTTQR